MLQNPSLVDDACLRRETAVSHKDLIYGLPLLIICYVIFFLDRMYISVAALRTNESIGAAPAVIGLAAVLLVTYMRPRRSRATTSRPVSGSGCRSRAFVFAWGVVVVAMTAIQEGTSLVITRLLRWPATTTAATGDLPPLPPAARRQPGLMLSITELPLARSGSPLAEILVFRHPRNLEIPMKTLRKSGRSQVRRRGRLGCIASIGAALIVLSGCGGGDSAAEAGAIQPLSVTTYGAYAANADVWVAAAQGFFDDFGVDVTVKNAGATAATNVAAGRDDLVYVTATGAFPTAGQGRDVSIIFQSQQGLSADILASADSEIDNVMDLAGKKLGTLAPGTGYYGIAQLYSDYIVENGGEAPTLTTVRSVDGSILDSGIIDAVLSVPDSSPIYVDSGQAKYVVNGATSDVARELAPETVVGYTQWGLKDNLSRKRESVVRYVAALRKANEWMATADDAEIAAALHTQEGFREQDIEQLTTSIAVLRPNFTTTGGEILEQHWTQSLDVWSRFAIPDFDATDERYAFHNIVDMSYWQSSESAEEVDK